MRVSVVFTKNVERVANQGEIKMVAAGFARNFLFPNGLAEPATSGARKRAEHLREEVAKKIEAEAEAASTEAKALLEREVRIGVKADERGRMFGSVTAKDIVAMLAKDGVMIDVERIVLPKPLKTLGEHELEADFGLDKNVPFTVILKAE